MSNSLVSTSPSVEEVSFTEHRSSRPDAPPHSAVINTRPRAAPLEELGFSFGPGVPRAPSQASEWSRLVGVLAAMDELALLADHDQLTRRAVELARDIVGLERVALYLAGDRLPSGDITVRGTWGTDLHGETTDERALSHAYNAADAEQLRAIPHSGALWMYHEAQPHYAGAAEPNPVIGRGWLAVTPLIANGEVLGILYNDTARSHEPVDETRQACAVVFCRLFANLLLARRGKLSPSPFSVGRASSPLIRQAVQSLRSEPLVSSSLLAKTLGISAPHLARTFKAEMGTSIVEYRNHVKLERFFRALTETQTTLHQAALMAGFGSYSQFYRVYRRILGTNPSDRSSVLNQGVEA